MTSALPFSGPSTYLPAALDELEALGLVVGKAGLEQHRVHAELCVEQRHVAIHLDEEVDALMALVEVGVIVRECLGAAGAAEGPARGHLTNTKQRAVSSTQSFVCNI